MKSLRSFLFFCSLAACLFDLNFGRVFAQEQKPQIVTNAVKTEEASTESKSVVLPKVTEKPANVSAGSF